MLIGTLTENLHEMQIVPLRLFFGNYVFLMKNGANLQNVNNFSPLKLAINFIYIYPKGETNNTV